MKKIDKYFCVENGQTQGPFTLQELKNKGLKSIDLVYPAGGDRWIRVDSVEVWSKIRPEVQEDDLFNLVTPDNSGKSAFQSSVSEQKSKVVLPETKSSFDIGDVISIHLDSTDGKQNEVDSFDESSTTGIDSHFEKHQSLSPEEGNEVLSAPSQATTKMGFWEAYALGWSRFTDFNGRSRRLEYWSWSLVNFIIMLSFIALTVPFGLGSASSDLLLSLYVIFCVVCVIPGVALSIRRLHDIGFTGWWILITIVPYASLLLLVFAFVDSQKETNKWGSSPKYESSR